MNPIMMLAAISLLLGGDANAAVDSLNPQVEPNGVFKPVKHQQLLDAHNRIRSEVQAAPLSWSDAAEAQAQRWADTLAQRCDIEHSQGSGFGENLFMGTIGYYDELDGIKAWEEEKRNYNGQPLSRSLAPSVGHYTQMIWPSTRELGCATSVCNNIMILVCNYYPPGNYLGESAY